VSLATRAASVLFEQKSGVSANKKEHLCKEIYIHYPFINSMILLKSSD
jgi:hypothetical protein